MSNLNTTYHYCRQMIFFKRKKWQFVESIANIDIDYKTDDLVDIDTESNSKEIEETQIAYNNNNNNNNDNMHEKN